MIFDVKLGENFRRKATLVGGGHTTTAPASITYSSFAPRDSVRTALTIAALNDLDILACDIQNSYLTECAKKIFGPGRAQDDSKDGALWFQVIRSGVQRKVIRSTT